MSASRGKRYCSTRKQHYHLLQKKTFKLLQLIQLKIHFFKYCQMDQIEIFTDLLLRRSLK